MLKMIVRCSHLVITERFGDKPGDRWLGGRSGPLRKKASSLLDVSHLWASYIELGPNYKSHHALQHVHHIVSP